MLSMTWVRVVQFQIPTTFSWFAHRNQQFGKRQILFTAKLLQLRKSHRNQVSQINFNRLREFFCQMFTLFCADKLSYQTKRVPYQPRIVAQANKSKYQQKLNNAIPDTMNRSPVHNPNQLRYQKTSKRNRYKSRCRCERISNCPRIQISVTRCEPNYFLCCF